MIGMTFN